MESKYIHFKTFFLDDRNRFSFQLTKKVIEKIKTSKNNNYLLNKLKTNPKIENDITKQRDYDRIKKSSDQINQIEKRYF